MVVNAGEWQYKNETYMLHDALLIYEGSGALALGFYHIC